MKRRQCGGDHNLWMVGRQETYPECTRPKWLTTPFGWPWRTANISSNRARPGSIFQANNTMTTCRTKALALCAALLFYCVATVNAQTLEVCRPTSNTSADSGIGIVGDTTCVSRGTGCLDDFCHLFNASVSMEYLPCSSPNPLPEPVPIVAGPATWTASGNATTATNYTNSTNATATDMGSGGNLMTTTMTTAGTNSSGSPNASTTTTIAPEANATSMSAVGPQCTTTLSATEQLEGLGIFTDPTCQTGNTGCLSALCRVCRLRSTGAMQHLAWGRLSEMSHFKMGSKALFALHSCNFHSFNPKSKFSCNIHDRTCSGVTFVQHASQHHASFWACILGLDTSQGCHAQRWRDAFSRSFR